MKRIFSAVLGLAAVSLFAGEVVVYTALDREFSEPILKTFEAKTGVKVRAVYDTEVDKSVGLVNKIRAEKRRPRCDVFWNNEVVNTMRLMKEGLLEPYAAKAGEDYPKHFRDAKHHWYGFAGRARVIIVNTELVKKGETPDSIQDFVDPKWAGKCGVARPLAGTTASHVACLFATWGEEKTKAFFIKMKANKVKVEAGNKQVATSVSSGRLAFGLTDTDDAMVEIKKGKPVAIVYPDGGKGESGVLFIPNTLSIIKGCPNAEAAKSLVEYLLSPDVETALSNGPSAQIPLNPKVTTKARVETPKTVTSMVVDFAKAADQFDKAATFIRKTFLR